MAVQSVGSSSEEALPNELWAQFHLTKRHLQIFLSVEDPQDWPPEMAALCAWLDEQLGDEW